MKLLKLIFSFISSISNTILKFFRNKLMYILALILPAFILSRIPMFHKIYTLLAKYFRNLHTMLWFLLIFNILDFSNPLLYFSVLYEFLHKLFYELIDKLFSNSTINKIGQTVENFNPTKVTEKVIDKVEEEYFSLRKLYKNDVKKDENNYYYYLVGILAFFLIGLLSYFFGLPFIGSNNYDKGPLSPPSTPSTPSEIDIVDNSKVVYMDTINRDNSLSSTSSSNNNLNNINNRSMDPFAMKYDNYFRDPSMETVEEFRSRLNQGENTFYSPDNSLNNSPGSSTGSITPRANSPININSWSK